MLESKKARKMERKSEREKKERLTERKNHRERESEIVGKIKSV